MDENQTSAPGIERLRAGGAELIIDTGGSGLPRILHWGRDLGDLSDGELERIALTNVAQVTSYVLDTPVPVAVLPEHATGYAGFRASKVTGTTERTGRPCTPRPRSPAPMTPAPFAW